ncbi:hypothetical protein [Mucilaginibacter terrae]|uniref:Uncharacterized protein n=1 Tax=Mucilaginibacter terrae TaxID=1955052 RepID=A0ABU3GVG5_9SPHI|nr:hypothetical protein [Mucilaginibacter terrae]MDT3403764.1 hypothetical protein [Mucilaginibacter terrae]
MVRSSAPATLLQWSLSPGIPWSVCRGMGVQFAPEWDGHFHQNLQIVTKDFSVPAIFYQCTE